MAEDEVAPTARPLDVYDFAATMLEHAAAIAWQKLGLQPDLATGSLEPDLGQAKVAIDLAAHLAAVVEGQLDDADRRRLQNLVRDLRLNYVERRGA